MKRVKVVYQPGVFGEQAILFFEDQTPEYGVTSNASLYGMASSPMTGYLNGIRGELERGEDVISVKDDGKDRYYILEKALVWRPMLKNPFGTSKYCLLTPTGGKGLCEIEELA